MSKMTDFGFEFFDGSDAEMLSGHLPIPANTNAAIDESLSAPLDPWIEQFLKRFAGPRRKASRSHYLPRASVLDKLSYDERVEVLTRHRRRLEAEVCYKVLTTCSGRRKFLKAARERMSRLERLAHSYGIWVYKGDDYAA